MSGFSDFIFEAELVARSIGDYFSGAPLRLGVTGLSRAGKTVFLTALVDNLIAGARLPVLAASAEGRSSGKTSSSQPGKNSCRCPRSTQRCAVGEKAAWMLRAHTAK